MIQKSKIAIKLIMYSWFGVFLLCYSALAAPTHIIEDGQLVGVDGLDVNGILYDVRFIDDHAISLFGTWNGGSSYTFDFDFETQEESVAASTALLDSISSAYKNNTTLISGITDSSLAAIFTPYDYFMDGFSPKTWSSYVSLSWLDQMVAGPFELYASTDLTTQSDKVYAKWTPSSPVPVPGSFMLLGTGLIALARAGRRNRQ